MSEHRFQAKDLKFSPWGNGSFFISDVEAGMMSTAFKKVNLVGDIQYGHLTPIVFLYVFLRQSNKPFEKVENC